MRSGKYYQAVKTNGVKKDVHRKMMEDYIGRSLMPDEVVHHINGNKQDNRIENLAIMSLREHSRLHCTGKPLSEKAKRKLSDFRKGKPSPCRKLTRDMILSAKSEVESGKTLRAIAGNYNVCHSTLSRALSGVSYGDIARDCPALVRYKHFGREKA